MVLLKCSCNSFFCAGANALTVIKVDGLEFSLLWLEILAFRDVTNDFRVANAWSRM